MIMQTNTKAAARAFTRVELVCVVGVVFLLVGWAALALGPAREKARQITCVGRIGCVGLGFSIFSSDHTNSFPFSLSTNQGGTLEWAAKPWVVPHLKAISNEFSTPRLLYCPADLERKPATDFSTLSETNISYFIGLTASENSPQSILSGDRVLMTNGIPLKNQFLEIRPGLVLDFAAGSHRGRRNFVLGDGSVQQCSPTRLAEHLKYLMDSTNGVQRWVFP